ncbi:MAG: hypothetical protein HYV95_03605 [Opitutae bacterium]|nr:hypothetical protein [Opitutae bacterium]
MFGLLIPAEGASLPSLSSLVNRSPFGPVRKSDQPDAGVAHGPLQFRGMLSEGDKSIFSLFESASGRSYWIGLQEETGQGIFVLGYDVDRRELLVEYRGQKLALPLRSAPVSRAVLTAASTLPSQQVRPEAVGPVTAVGDGAVQQVEAARQLQQAAVETLHRRRAVQPSPKAPAGQP